MDPIRRDILTTGAVAAVTAAAPQVFAQQPDPGGAFRVYEKGDVRIRYQDVGSGFPLLVTPGGGLNSCMRNWATAVINARMSSRATSAASPWTSATPQAVNPRGRFRSMTRGALSPTINWD